MPDPPSYAYGRAVALWHAFWDEPDMVVVGDAGDAVALARAFRARHPDRLGGFAVPRAGAERLVAEDGYAEVVRWAFRWTAEPPPLPVAGAEWLPPEAADEVRAVLAAGFPDAAMPVGHPAVRRWAGVRRDGRLVACAADATMVEGLGFLSSIASHPDVRGTGAGTAVTAWATAELVREQGHCALWLMADNAVAAALYTRLGYRDDDPMAVVAPPGGP